MARELQRDSHVLTRRQRRATGCRAGARARPPARGTRASPASSSSPSERSPARTSPAEGSSSAAASASIVLLPQPEGPSTATSSPRSTRSSRPRSATVSTGPERKILKTSWNWSAGQSICSLGQLGLDVQALDLAGGSRAQCQLKLLIIFRYASTLSTPLACRGRRSRACRRWRARSGRRSTARSCRSPDSARS